MRTTAHWLRKLLRLRFKTWLRRRDIERDLDEEMQFHVEMQTRHNVQGGMPVEEARRTALVSFGGLERFKEEARDVRPGRWLEDGLRDARYAVRALRRNPVFSLVAVLTLSVSIGAGTVIFSVVNHILLRPLPYPHGAELVTVWNRASNISPARLRVAAPDVQVFREESALFQDFGFLNGVEDVMLTAEGRFEHARLGVVTRNLFDVLGIVPWLGEGFGAGGPSSTPSDSADSASRDILLSFELWRTRFGSDSSIVGRSIGLDDQTARVVGVLPPGTTVLVPHDAGLVADADAWIPLDVPLSEFRRVDRMQDQDTDNSGVVFGRLRAGIAIDQARAEMDAVASRLRSRVPSHRDAGTQIEVVPLHDDLVGHVRPALHALAGAVAMVVLIACLNIANLLLARAIHRRREITLRTALGAGRFRLIRQLFVESVVLAMIGAVGGLIVATFGLSLITSLASETVPELIGSNLNPAVLLFALGTAVVSAVLFGLFPAFGLSASAGALTARQQVITVPGWRSGGTVLLVAELAMSVVLLVGAGLLTRSFTRLLTVHPGFNPTSLLTFNVSFTGNPGGPATRARMLARLTDRVRALPGVAAVGFSGGLPLSGVTWTQPYGLDGVPVERWEESEANFRVISSDYLAAMGTRLLAGRNFTAEEDVSERERVAIVDELLARRVVQSGDAVGRVIGFPLDGAPVQARIVGVVEAVRYASLEDVGRETIYVPYRQEASRQVGVAVRSTIDPVLLIGSIQRLFATAADGPVVAYDFRPMDRYVAEALAPTRLALLLITAFSAIAMIITAVGVYGVTSYTVSRRVHEIGIRMALGGRSWNVLAEIVTPFLRRVLLGIVAGWIVGLYATRAISSMIYGVETTDLATYLTVGLILLIVASGASYIPARRATRVLPLEALRGE